MKKLLYILSLVLLSTIASVAQSVTKIGAPYSSVKTLGGLRVDSGGVQLPILNPAHKYTQGGMDTNGVIYISFADSLPVFTKKGATKKVITKYDSAVVYVDVGEVGHPYGVAGLDATGVVPSVNLPAITISGQVYIDTNQAQMLSHVSATAGALSVRTDSGSALFVLVTTPSSVRANWHLTQGNGVSAFNGRTGAVSPTSGDYTTTLVPEGTNLYYTSARTQGIIATDTAAGWLPSKYQVDTAIRNVGSAASLNTVLGNGNTSNRAISLGKVNSSNAYSAIKMIVTPGDSSGYITMSDSSHTSSVVLAATGGLTAVVASAGSNAIALNTQSTSGGTQAVINDFGRTSTWSVNSLGFSASSVSLNYYYGLSSNHISGAGSAPSIAAGAGAGGSPVISISGTDLAGYITLTTGATPVGGSIVCTVTFSTLYLSAPKCIVLTPANIGAVQLTTTRFPYVNQASISASSFVLNSNSIGLNASTTYQWYYHVIQ